MIGRLFIIFVTVLSFAMSLPDINRRPRALQIICIFLALTMTSEFIAFYMAFRYRNNLPVFHILSPLLLLNLAWYFDAISSTVRRYKLSYVLGASAVMGSVLNTIFWQPLHTFNFNYLLFQGLCICSLGFIALFDMEKNDNMLYPGRTPHFWITVIVLLQQIGVYFLYILIGLLELSHGSDFSFKVVYTSLLITTVSAYPFIGLVYLVFPIKNTQQ